MALISFGVPTMEIASGKEPVAIMFLASRKFKVFKIKLFGSFFIIDKGNMRGLYEIDPTKAWFYEKTPCFFFDQRNAKPMDPVLVHEILEFADKNKLHKVTRKDVKHASTLRMLKAKTGDTKEALERTKTLGGETQNQIDSSINEFFNSAEAKNADDDKTKKAHTFSTEEDYTYALTAFLHSKALLSQDEAMLLEERVRTHNITFDELISDLRTKEVVSIQTPITVDAQRFLDDFHTYDPARVSSFVDSLNRIDKKLKTMTSIPIKNWIPASLVIAISVGVIMGVMVMITQWTQIQGLFEKLMPPATPITPPHLILGLKSFIMTRLHI